MTRCVHHVKVVVDVRERTGGDRLRGCQGHSRIDDTRVPVGGDVIVGIGGQPVRSHEGLTRQLLTDADPGVPVRLTVLRDGRELTLETVPAERPVTDVDRRRAGAGGTMIPVE